MDNNYALMDLTVYGRRAVGRLAGRLAAAIRWIRAANGRPIAQFSRIAAGRSDDLTAD